MGPVNNGSTTCLVFLFLLVIAFIIGFVVYVFITENRIKDLEGKVDKLETQPAQPQQTRRLDISNVLAVRQQERPSALPAAPPPSRAPVLAKPEWATATTPKYVQFETPSSDAPTVLHVPGVSKAEQRGYKIECNFGGSRAEPARDQIDLEFHVNDETGDESITLRVRKPQYWGRQCVLQWLE